MIHVLCDFCGRDTDRTATLLSILQDAADVENSGGLCNECQE